MSGLTHITGGLLLGSAIVCYSHTAGAEPNFLTVAAFFTGCISGAVLGDLDEPKSLIGRKLWPISFLFRFTHWFFRIIAMILPKKSRIRKNIAGISRAAGHRGLMHWPLTMLLLSAIFFLLAHAASQYINLGTNIIFYSIAFGISIGMLSHLIYDFPSGTLPLLAPFSNKRYGIKLIESNKFIDTYIIRTLNLLGCVYLLSFK